MHAMHAPLDCRGGVEREHSRLSHVLAVRHAVIRGLVVRPLVQSGFEVDSPGVWSRRDALSEGGGGSDGDSPEAPASA